MVGREPGNRWLAGGDEVLARMLEGSETAGRRFNGVRHRDVARLAGALFRVRPGERLDLLLSFPGVVPGAVDVQLPSAERWLASIDDLCLPFEVGEDPTELPSLLMAYHLAVLDGLEPYPVWVSFNEAGWFAFCSSERVKGRLRHVRL